MTNTTEVTPHQLAAEAQPFFETATRDGGGSYVRLKDDAPDWLKELARDAHGRDATGAPAMLPDDYRYEFARDAIDAIAEVDPEYDLDDVAHEMADAVDVYTGALMEWFGSHAERSGYCDEAARDGLIEPDADMSRRLMAGQYAERREVFELVRHSLEAEAEERELA